MKRKTNRKPMHWLILHNSQDWTGLNPGARNSIQVSLMDDRTQSVEPSLILQNGFVFVKGKRKKSKRAPIL